MRFFLLLIIGFLILFSRGDMFAFSWWLQTFITTAYYSPLPNQTYYLYGDYESEKKVQGEGTHGASGLWVHTGMLAAPKNYPFWTKIHLEGFWVWVVADRGGAIVAQSESWFTADRLDIWVGVWEEWLKRALAWGKRTITGSIVAPSTPLWLSLTSLDTKTVTFPKWKTGSFSSLDQKIVFASWGTQKYPQSLNTWREHAVMMIEALWYDTSVWFSGAILQYQLDRGIISKSTASGAWVYGPKTRAALIEEYAVFDKRGIENPAQKVLIDEQKLWTEKYEKAKHAIDSLGTLKVWSQWKHVRTLQLLLKKQGYFSQKDTGIFGSKTEEALRRFQRDHGIPLSGKLDLATRERFVQEMVEKD